jgi:hypothetical protein
MQRRNSLGCGTVISVDLELKLEGTEIKTIDVEGIIMKKTRLTYGTA